MSSAWSRAQRAPRTLGDGEPVRLLDAAPVIGGGRPPVIGERDGKARTGVFEDRVRPILDGELRLEGGGDAPGEQALLGLGRQCRKRREPLRRRQGQPPGIERVPLRLEQAVGRRAGQIVQRAARPRLDCPQIERTRAIAVIEHIDAQRIERQVERHPEIRREMGPGDLQPVRLQVVDEHLAEAAFLAHGLLGGRGGGGCLVVFGRREAGLLVAVVAGVGGMGAGSVAGRRAVDEPFMEKEFAVIADRDDAAGDGAVFAA